MPIGIVSDKEFEEELERLQPKPGGSNVPPPVIESPTSIIESPKRGRAKGAVEVPDALRKVIGDESVTGGKQSAIELAQSFGISPSSTSAYAVGATSTSSYDDRPNKSTITNAKERVSRIARGKLVKALRHITEDKLEDAKARDLAGIAKDMSAVVRNMEPEPDKIQQNNAAGPQFIFYSPQFKKEEHYETVVVKE